MRLLLHKKALLTHETFKGFFFVQGGADRFEVQLFWEFNTYRPAFKENIYTSKVKYYITSKDNILYGKQKTPADL